MLKSRRSGKRWTVELIKKLWGIAWDLWEHCNGILHDSQNAVSERELWQLNKEVTDVFNLLQARMLPIHDRHLLSLKLSRLLKKDKVYKEVWIHNAMFAVNGCNRNRNTRHISRGIMAGMRCCMKRFLR